MTKGGNALAWNAFAIIWLEKECRTVLPEDSEIDIIWLEVAHHCNSHHLEEGYPKSVDLLIILTLIFIEEVSR